MPIYPRARAAATRRRYSIRRLFRDDETHFVELARHFFARFFASELVSREGEAHLTLVHVLALLATPTLLYTLYLFQVYDDIGQNHPAVYAAVSLVDRSRYVTLAMVVIGFVAVLEWDALFPDYRDYVVLTVLPLRASTVFAAKVAALGVFAALFIVDVSGLPTLAYPLVEAQALPDPRVSLLHLLRTLVAHGVAVASASAFVFLFFVALEGLLISLLDYRWFKRVSLYVQVISIVALLSMFFLLPMFSELVPAWRRTPSLELYALPPMWYLGLYQTLLGAAGGRSPVDLELARIGLEALGAVAAVAVLAYVASYRKYVRRSFEQTEAVRSGPGWTRGALGRLADRFIVPRPLERAAFYFVSKTIARSARHRLYFAAYVGVGCALVVEGLVTLAANRRLAPGGGSGGNSDPAGPSATLLSIPLVLSFFALSGMRVVFPIPADLRANWIFQLTEGDRRRECLAGVRKAMLVWTVGPLFLALLPVYALVWGWWVALVELAFGVILSLALVELLMLRFSKIPFTCSFLPGKANITLLGFFYWFAFTTYAYSMAWLEAWMIERPISLVAFFGLAIPALAWLVAYRNRLLEAGFTFTYEDVPEPAVRRLNLNE